MTHAQETTETSYGTWPTELRAPVAESLAEVDRRLAVVGAEMPEQLRVGTASLLRAGKRLRPLVLLLAAGGASSGERAVALATAVEEIHVASLIHDDVLDGSETRRGCPSAPAVLGQRCAVLAGDYLAAAAYREVSAAQVPGAPEALAEAAVRMTLAEVHGSTSAGELLSEAGYLDIISGKTAALFEVSSYLGSMVAGLSPADQEALRRYGANVGMAFQIRDDLLDLWGEAGKLGKPVRKDLSEGIYTLPIIAAAAAPGGEVLRKRLAQLRGRSMDGGLAEEVADLARRLGGEDYAGERMVLYAREAVAALPEVPFREQLRGLALGLAERDT